MTFAGSAQVHPSLPAWRRLARAGGAVAAAAMLLSACGGGDQVKKLEPKSFVSFGDESSAFGSVVVGGTGDTTTIKGFKYSVNSVGYLSSADETEVGVRTLAATQPGWDAIFPQVAPVSNSLKANALPNGTVLLQQDFVLTTAFTDAASDDVTIHYLYTYDCYTNPLWVQTLARSYGLGFKDQCPAEVNSGAVSYAESGATVATTAAQVAAHRGELGATSLVTMMSGQNDILSAYAQVKAGTLSLDAAKVAMTNQGGALALIVNDIIKTGARVLVVKLPDLGLTPYARAEGSSGMSALNALTLAFNNGILNKITNDGTKIGLVNLYDYTRYIRDANDRGNSYDNIVNISSAVCADTVYKPDGAALTGASSAPLYGGDGLLFCSNLTANSGVTSITNYFWSDRTHLGVGGHNFLAARAYERADDNPF